MNDSKAFLLETNGIAVMITHGKFLIISSEKLHKTKIISKKEINDVNGSD